MKIGLLKKIIRDIFFTLAQQNLIIMLHMLMRDQWTNECSKVILDLFTMLYVQCKYERI